MSYVRKAFSQVASPDHIPRLQQLCPALKSFASVRAKAEASEICVAGESLSNRIAVLRLARQAGIRLQSRIPGANRENGKRSANITISFSPIPGPFDRRQRERGNPWADPSAIRDRAQDRAAVADLPIPTQFNGLRLLSTRGSNRRKCSRILPSVHPDRRSEWSPVRSAGTGGCSADARLRRRRWIFFPSSLSAFLRTISWFTGQAGSAVRTRRRGAAGPYSAARRASRARDSRSAAAFPTTKP